MFTNVRTLRVAASVAILIIAGFFAFRNSLLDLVAPHRLTAMSSTPGKIKKHILSDGFYHLAERKQQADIPVTFGNGDRVVTLEGGALF